MCAVDQLIVVCDGLADGELSRCPEMFGVGGSLREGRVVGEGEWEWIVGRGGRRSPVQVLCCGLNSNWLSYEYDVMVPKYQGCSFLSLKCVLLVALGIDAIELNVPASLVVAARCGTVRPVVGFWRLVRNFGGVD